MTVKRSHAPSRALRALALAASLGLFGCAEYAGIPVALRGECPSWPVYGPEPHSNEPSPYLGCSNAVNLTNMVDEQTDLARGRPLGPADGEHEALGVKNYEQGKVKAFAPINAPTPAIVAPTMGAAGQ